MAKIPNKTGSSDDYQTPPHALKPLFQFIPPEWIIWECAQGKRSLVRGFQERGYQVIGTDIDTGHNFLTWEPDKYDVIVTNPPYSIKQQFLVRAYSLKKPFAFLLPLTTFETSKRQELFKKHGLEVIMFDKRINFETPTKRASTAWFATAWFTSGLNIGKQLTFVKYNEMKGIQETLFKEE